jgi:adenylosuccinate lyase
MVLWLERDISHSSTERFTFPDVFGCLAYSARLLTEVLTGLVVYTDRMAQNVEATHGAIYGSRLLNALLATERIGRTEAYELVKRLAQQALDTGVHLRELAARDPQITALLGTEDLDDLFRPDFYLRNIDVAYRRVGMPFPPPPAADRASPTAHEAAQGA